MILVALTLSLALAAEPIHQTLTLPRDVWDVTAHDLNEDGFLDLIVLYGEREDALDVKGIYVFLARSDGSYAKTPTSEFPLHPDTGNAFFSQREGRQQLVMRDPQGATQYRFLDGAFIETHRYAFESLLPLHTREPIFLRNVSHDLNGDQSDEWLVPVLNGFDVLEGAEKVAFLKGEVFSEVFRHNGLNAIQRIPEVFVFDRAGQKNKAVGIVDQRGATMHYGGEWELSHRHELVEKAEEQWDTQTAMEDINHDGYPDLMVTNTQGTANIQVLTEIYFATPDLKFPSKPSFALTSKGGLAAPILVDINNDEKLDLIVRGFPINLRNITSFLFRRKISMQMETYPFGNGGFSDKPAYTNNVTADVSEGREEIALTYGDFDGDGAKDVAVGARSSSLTIFTHSADGDLASRAWKTIDVHTFGIARTADLDASGKDDIIIYHPRGKFPKDIEVIRF